MIKLFNNKRANWIDVFDFGGQALGIAILLVVVGYLLFSFNTTLSSSGLINDSVALDYSDDMQTNFPKATDFILPMLFIFTLGFSVWSARKVESSHKFAFFGIIVLVVLFLFGMGIETMWDKFSTNVTFNSYVNSNYPITDFMMNNLRIFILVMGFIVGVSLYTKES